MRGDAAEQARQRDEGDIRHRERGPPGQAFHFERTESHEELRRDVHLERERYAGGCVRSSTSSSSTRSWTRWNSISVWLSPTNRTPVSASAAASSTGDRISPLVVFVGIFFWGWVLGPVGMLLSVPLTMSLKMAMEGDERTRWIAVLLGVNVAAQSVGSGFSDALEVPASETKDGFEALEEHFDGFYSRGGLIYPEDDQIFAKKPKRLMRMFLHTQKRHLKLSPEIRRLYKGNWGLINQRFRRSRRRSSSGADVAIGVLGGLLSSALSSGSSTGSSSSTSR